MNEITPQMIKEDSYMYLVHDRTVVLAYGFPSKALARIYANVCISFGDDGENIKVCYQGDCNLTKEEAIMYVGQRICPITEQEYQTFTKV